MIKAVFYHKNKSYIGFSIEGHAGYAHEGKDIICSAVSALATTTINSIDTLTRDEIIVQACDDGVIKMRFADQSSQEAQLLVRALRIGLLGIYEEYGNRYLQLYFKEV
jgi:hypothetical protein